MALGFTVQVEDRPQQEEKDMLITSRQKQCCVDRSRWRIRDGKGHLNIWSRPECFWRVCHKAHHSALRQCLDLKLPIAFFELQC